MLLNGLLLPEFQKRKSYLFKAATWNFCSTFQQDATCAFVCSCVHVYVRVGVYVLSPPLEGKHSAVPLHKKCWVWGMVSDDKSKGQTASKADILYSLSFTPPTLSLHPSLHLFLSSSSLKSPHLTVIHCAWWVVKCKKNFIACFCFLLFCSLFFFIHPFTCSHSNRKTKAMWCCASKRWQWVINPPMITDRALHCG